MVAGTGGVKESLPTRLARLRRRASALLKRSLDASLIAAEPELDDRTAPVAADDGSLGRLEELQRAFALPDLALEILVCLVALEIDPLFRLVVRFSQGEGGHRWFEVGTIVELLGIEPSATYPLRQALGPDRPLRMSNLVLVDENEHQLPFMFVRVRVIPFVARFLVGDDEPAEGIRILDEPRNTLAQAFVHPKTLETALHRLHRSLRSSRGGPLVVEIHGAPGSGRRFFAEGLAAALGEALLLCDLSTVEPSMLDQRLAELRVELRLRPMLVCIACWDHHMPQTSARSDEHGEAPPERTPRRLPPKLAEFIAKNQGVILLTAQHREPLLESVARSLLPIEVRFPTPSERAALLDAAVAEHRGMLDPALDVAALMRRYALDPARIERAASAAVEMAETSPDPDRTGHIDATILHQACRAQLSHSLESLATRVTATHQLKDLVVSEEVYQGILEMIARVRHARRVYDEWGFAERHSLTQGLSALFAGPPGTGKTMCASVMAHELDMELFRVDLSRVVSKWIGETEKNLARIFDEAQRGSALILFDEADSLFARRTEIRSSVDRYANLEVNYLLQRMESFAGITILTTNFEDTIDTAFKRRLTFRLRFEKPDAQARAALWRKMFPQSCQRSDDIDFERLGEMFEMSGGNIRNAALRAAFLAAAADDGQGRILDMDACIQSAEREAREMGLLTHSPTPTRYTPYPPRPEPPRSAPPERLPGSSRPLQ